MVSGMKKIRVLLPVEPRRWQKRVYLHSQMVELRSIAFVWVTTTIGGRDAVEEYVACKMHPLAASFGFESVPLGTTSVSKVETPLLVFAVGIIAAGDADRVLEEIETVTARVLGSFRPREYDALGMVNIQNGGRLNQVLE
jgi:hypothetical protein